MEELGGLVLGDQSRKLVWIRLILNLYPLTLAYKSLNDLLILHRATQLHNGGDAQGGVYPNLWHHFLHPLSQSINLSY